MDLKDIRQDIDAIDEQIVSLLKRRMDCSKKVAEIKSAAGLEIYHPKREAEIIKKVTDQGENYGTYIGELYTLLMECSRELQHQQMQTTSNLKALVETAESTLALKNTIACYGEEGAFTQIALNSAFEEKNITPIFSKTFEGVFEKVNSNETDFGFLPVENSSAGSVNEVYDLILKYKLYIVGSVSMPVVHNLLSLKDAELKSIKTVYSHAQAISQCQGFLNKHGISSVNYLNTAASAKHVSETNDISIGAIGSKECAEKYGLKILMPSIQSFENNKTRFIVISKKPIIPKNSNKISLVFSLSNTPGSLQKILTRFSVQGLNLTKLESRVGKNGDFESQFYLDFLGSVTSKETLSLLSALSTELNDFTFLGNYKEINL